MGNPWTKIAIKTSVMAFDGQAKRRWINIGFNHTSCKYYPTQTLCCYCSLWTGRLWLNYIRGVDPYTKVSPAGMFVWCNVSGVTHIGLYWTKPGTSYWTSVLILGTMVQLLRPWLYISKIIREHMLPCRTLMKFFIPWTLFQVTPLNEWVSGYRQW